MHQNVFIISVRFKYVQGVRMLQVSKDQRCLISNQCNYELEITLPECLLFRKIWARSLLLQSVSIFPHSNLFHWFHSSSNLFQSLQRKNLDYFFRQYTVGFVKKFFLPPSRSLNSAWHGLHRARQRTGCFATAFFTGT